MNDLQTLYNASSDKDELAQIAEKLNIEDGKLPEILVALAEASAPLEVTDITALTAAQLDALEIGAKVAKITGTAKHLYLVSYKDAENGGLCLTYTDASTVETVSYDHTESGWAYNSIDKTNIGG